MAETTVPVPIDISKLDPDAGTIVLALQLFAPEKLSQIERAVATSQEVQDASRLLLEEAQRFLELNRGIKEFLAFFQKRDLQIAATKLGRFTDVLESLKESESEYQSFLDQLKKMIRELFDREKETPPSPEVVPSRFSPLFDGRGAVDAHAGGGLVPVDGRASEAGGLGTLVATFDGGAESVDRLSESMGRFRQVSRDTLEEIDQVATATFRRLEEVLIGFAETGKFAWRDLARVALDAIGDIFAAQMKAAGAASSGAGGIGGILSGITSALGGLFGGGAPTPLQLSGPFQHGGSFVVGGSGAPDSRLVSFLATPGERVDVLTPAQQGALGGLTPQQTVNQKFVINISPGVPEAVRAGILQLKPQIQQWAIEGVMAASMRGGAIARMPRV